MNLIPGVLSIIGAAIVGLIVNIFAHDFCQRAPAFARWLLAIATRSLPLVDRPRYAEEWAAHLADCEGVCAKLCHAFGCLWCARRMRRQTLSAMTLSVSFNLPNVGQAVVRTNFYEVGTLIRLYWLFARSKPTNYAYLRALTLIFWYRAFVDAHERSGVKGSQFVGFVRRATREEWIPTAVTLAIGGEQVELIAVARELGSLVTVFLEKIAQALKVEVAPTGEGPKIAGDAT